jgi:hypothetical protein
VIWDLIPEVVGHADMEFQSPKVLWEVDVKNGVRDVQLSHWTGMIERVW